jgi:hypothetical protein
MDVQITMVVLRDFSERKICEEGHSLFPDNSLLMKKHKNILMLNHFVIQWGRAAMVYSGILSKHYFPVYSCLTGILGKTSSHQTATTAR